MAEAVNCDKSSFQREQIGSATQGSHAGLTNYIHYYNGSQPPFIAGIRLSRHLRSQLTAQK